MKRTLITSITLLFAAAVCFAQGPRSTRQGGGAGTSQFDMSKLQTVTGAIAAVNIGYGMQYPSITLNKVQIKIAPAWYLLDKGFEMKVGEFVSVVAAPSTISSDPYLYAVEVTNLCRSCASSYATAQVFLLGRGAEAWLDPWRKEDVWMSLAR